MNTKTPDYLDALYDLREAEESRHSSAPKDGTGKAVEAADAKVRRYKMDATGTHVSESGRVLLEPAVSASDYDSARAETERLTTYYVDFIKERERASEAELTAIRAKLAEAERDAGRYRWLRDVPHATLHRAQPFIALYTGSFSQLKWDQADAAIDAAVQRGSTKGE